MGIKLHLPRREFGSRSVSEFIVSCRADGGIPQFKTSYAGEEFESDSEPAVMGVCYSGGRQPGVVFTDVPEEEVDLMEKRSGDWRRLIREHGTPSQVEETREASLSFPTYAFSPSEEELKEEAEKSGIGEVR